MSVEDHKNLWVYSAIYIASHWVEYYADLGGQWQVFGSMGSGRSPGYLYRKCPSLIIYLLSSFVGLWKSVGPIWLFAYQASILDCEFMG